MKSLIVFLFTMTQFLSIQSQNPESKTPIQPKITAIGITDKYIWIGTDQGLWRIKRSNYKMSHLTAENSRLPSNKINCIATDTDGSTWIGTSSGLLRFDNYAYYRITKENVNLPDYNIRSLAVDHDHNLWIATNNNGLSVVNQSLKYQNFNTRNSGLHSDSIQYIFKNQDHRICVIYADSQSQQISTLNYYITDFSKVLSGCPSNAVHISLPFWTGVLEWDTTNLCAGSLNQHPKYPNVIRFKPIPFISEKTLYLDNILEETNKCIELVMLRVEKLQ